MEILKSAKGVYGDFLALEIYNIDAENKTHVPFCFQKKWTRKDRDSIT